MPPKRKAPAAKTPTPAKRSKPAAPAKKTDKGGTKSAPKGKQTKSSTEKATAAGSCSKGGDLLSFLKDDGWLTALKDEFKEDYFKGIIDQLQQDKKAGVQVFPPENLIFNAFNKTPIDKIKVVILGQDPYHDDGQAMGMSFSVPDDVKIPPSLKNIYAELVDDPAITFTTPTHGNLTKWAENGVFLLNATLTVQAHKPNSHAKCGWQKFTDRVIQIISEQCDKVVFILWGGFAHKKDKLIDKSKHGVIKTAHPSPLSIAHFRKCRCFSNADKSLKTFGKKPMDWGL